MAVANGTCTRLSIQNREYGNQCSGKLLNTIYPDGRVGFYFVTEAGAALTFTGMGSRQVKPNADTAVQPVDGIFFTYKGKTDRLSAVGTCRFTNPYQRAGTVACHADTPNGPYEAAFRTDGKPPSVLNTGR
ncbi:hypothetical protein [Methylobacterium sp. E-046]|uniref:hypothetical protein n=1 Tax=Methylobacterium sp. E-046 TaxID=2836576 RepID=UPI001FBBF5C2|nr:hypothetical protein [Methylobacterium sp. E-046]MCJ2099468.1 hypothetical protein [Methylobacterium sp. E-046]